MTTVPGLPCELSLCAVGREGEVGRVLGGGYRVREFLSGLLTSVSVLNTLCVVQSRPSAQNEVHSCILGRPRSQEQAEDWS